MTENIFDKVDQLFGDAQIMGILVIVLILSLIIMNIVVCVCIISMRKSLKEISKKDCCCKKADKKPEKPADDKNHNKD